MLSVELESVVIEADYVEVKVKAGSETATADPRPERKQGARRQWGLNSGFAEGFPGTKDVVKLTEQAMEEAGTFTVKVVALNEAGKSKVTTADREHRSARRTHRSTPTTASSRSESEALRPVARDRGGDLVLGIVCGVDADVVHQDREDDRVAARVAIARERGDAGERARLCRAVALGGGAGACGRRGFPRGRRQGVSRETAAASSPSRATKTSSLPTSSGEASVLRESPEPSEALMATPASAANCSTSAAPRSRVPRVPVVAATRFGSISAKKLFEGTFVSSIRRATVGEATDPRGSAWSSAGVRFALPDLPRDRDPPRAQRGLQRSRREQLRIRGVFAAVVAVVEGEPGERAEIWAVAAHAVEDRVVGEDLAGDLLEAGPGRDRRRGWRRV